MRFLIAIVAATVLDTLAADEATPSAEQIRALVERLDNDDFRVRQQATTQLAQAGEAAIPLLSAALKSDSPEQRNRAAAVLRLIQNRRMARGFKALGEQGEDEIDVEGAMVLIAQILDPELSGKAIDKQLDELAAAVRRAAGEGVDVKSLPGAEVVALITDVLGTEYGLEVDSEHYDHPDNSSIHRVLEQKNGLPIMLSEIAVAVGRRLQVPIVGIAVPSNYMFKYDGSRAPAGLPEEDIIVDTYADWKIKSPELIAQRWRFNPGNLEASKPRATIERMLNNLEADFLEVGNHRRAAEVRRYRQLFSAE